MVRAQDCAPNLCTVGVMVAREDVALQEQVRILHCTPKGNMKICGVDFGLTTCFAVIDFTPEEVRIIDIQNYNLLHDSIKDRFLLYIRLQTLHQHIEELATQYKFDLVGVESTDNLNAKPYQLKVLLEKDPQRSREYQTKNAYFQQIVESFNYFSIPIYGVERKFEFETFVGRKPFDTKGQTEAFGKLLFRELVNITGLKGRDMRDAVAAAIALGCFHFDCPVPKSVTNDWLISQGYSFYVGRTVQNAS